MHDDILYSAGKLCLLDTALGVCSFFFCDGCQKRESVFCVLSHFVIVEAAGGLLEWYLDTVTDMHIQAIVSLTVQCNAKVFRDVA